MEEAERCYSLDNFSKLLQQVVVKCQLEKSQLHLAVEKLA